MTIGNKASNADKPQKRNRVICAPSQRSYCRWCGSGLFFRGGGVHFNLN